MRRQDGRILPAPDRGEEPHQQTLAHSGGRHRDSSAVEVDPIRRDRSPRGTCGEIGERVRLTVAGISPSLIDALINEMGPSFPEHVPGTRPIHSKGVGVAGVFVASQAARQYCTAKHFDGSSTPVTVRFSNGNGQLDPDGRLQVRGMAVKFFAGGTREPDHDRADSDENTLAGIGRVEDLPVVAKPGERVEETDLVLMSVPVFMAQTAERLLEFEKSYRARKVRRPSLVKRIKSLVTMCPLPPQEAGVRMSGNDGFLEWARSYAPAQAFLLENSGQRLPTSYARVVYHAVHAFEVGRSLGHASHGAVLTRAVRWRPGRRTR